MSSNSSMTSTQKSRAKSWPEAIICAAIDGSRIDTDRAVEPRRCAVPSSLHLVEHVRECRLEHERFLDFVCAHIGVFAVFQKARTLMLADELYECRSIGLPVRREAFEVFEDGLEPGRREQSHGILGVLVKVRIEDALIHEIGVPFDREEHPAQVVQLEHSETIGLGRDGLLDVPSILVEALFPSGDDFRKNREAIARWSFGKNRSVSPLLYLILEESPFWDRHRRRSGPTSLLRRI